MTQSAYTLHYDFYQQYFYLTPQLYYVIAGRLTIHAVPPTLNLATSIILLMDNTSTDPDPVEHVRKVLLECLSKNVPIVRLGAPGAKPTARYSINQSIQGGKRSRQNHAGFDAIRICVHSKHSPLHFPPENATRSPNPQDQSKNRIGFEFKFTTLRNNESQAV